MNLVLFILYFKSVIILLLQCLILNHSFNSTAVRCVTEASRMQYPWVSITFLLHWVSHTDISINIRLEQKRDTVSLGQQ